MRKGFSLVLTLVTLILVFSLVLVCIEFYRMSVVNYSQQAKLLQAANLARSGAITLFEWLRKKPSKLGELFQEGSTKRFTAYLDGSFQGLTYETYKSGSLYILKCTATVGGCKRSRTIVFKLTGGGFRHAIVSLGRLGVSNEAEVYGDVIHLGSDDLIISNEAKINGSVYVVKENVKVNISSDTAQVSISGDIYAKGSIENFHNVEVKGAIYCGGEVNESGNNSYQAKYENLPNIDDYFKDLPTSFPVPSLPAGNYANIIEGEGDLSLDENTTSLTIEANATYHGRVGGSLKVRKNSLIFKTNGNDMFIKIDGPEFNVDADGEIRIEGGGTVWIYAKKVTFSERSKLILKDNSNVVFFTDDISGAEYSFSNYVEIGGDGGIFVYAPNKKVIFSNDAISKPIMGAIVAKEVYFSNQTRFIPRTHLPLGQIVSGLDPDLQIERWE